MHAGDVLIVVQALHLRMLYSVYYSAALRNIVTVLLLRCCTCDKQLGVLLLHCFQSSVLFVKLVALITVVRSLLHACACLIHLHPPRPEAPDRSPRLCCGSTGSSNGPPGVCVERRSAPSSHRPSCVAQCSQVQGTCSAAAVTGSSSASSE
jgi:hypothetical protein